MILGVAAPVHRPPTNHPRIRAARLDVDMSWVSAAPSFSCVLRKMGLTWRIIPPWEPTTFISRGHNPYIGKINMEDTPWKINMEPENTPLRIRIPIKQPGFNRLLFSSDPWGSLVLILGGSSQDL